jgi:hypothetical protein
VEEEFSHKKQAAAVLPTLQLSFLPRTSCRDTHKTRR